MLPSTLYSHPTTPHCIIPVISMPMALSPTCYRRRAARARAAIRAAWLVVMVAAAVSLLDKRCHAGTRCQVQFNIMQCEYHEYHGWSMLGSMQQQQHSAEI